jgi:hypothetical protein
MVEQGSDRRVTAQPVDAAAAVRSYRPDRYAQPATDLGVRQWRVGRKQDDQPLVAGGEPGERCSQGGVALGQEQAVVGCLSELIWNALEVVRMLVGRVQAVSAPHPEAFTAGGGAEPARQSGRIAEAVQVVHQSHPDRLTDIFGVGSAQLVPAADRPDQRGMAFDECAPSLLVTFPGVYHQGDELLFLCCCLWPNAGHRYGHDPALL